MRLTSLFEEGAVTAFPSSRSPGLLSVTESVPAPALTKQGGHMSDIPDLKFREWLVPPVLVPLFFGLLIAAVAIFV
jgi:hypothetical protein